MIIIALAAAALSTMSPDAHQVMGANSGDIYSMEYEFVAGDTRKITRSADTYSYPSIKPKAKRLVTLIPKASPLAAIIARVKKENGIKTKS